MSDHLDLGVATVPNMTGLAVDIDLDPQTGMGKSFALEYLNSIASIQIFAAPASEDLWPEVRDSIVSGLRDQKVDCEIVMGAFGTEVRCVMPTVDLDGNSYVHPVRFLALTGDRWMMRVVVSGDAAVDGEAADKLNQVLREISVNRGDEPMPPGQRMTITVPGIFAEVQPSEQSFGHIHIDL